MTLEGVKEWDIPPDSMTNDGEPSPGESPDVPEQSPSFTTTISFTFRSSGVEHEYQFGTDTEEMVAWPEQFIQQGETYRTFDVPEFINQALQELGLEVVDR